MASLYENVEALNPARSYFSQGNTYDYDCKIGEIIPTCVEECVPKDTWILNNVITVRFQPTKEPISDMIEVKTDYFKVPFRLVFNEELDGVGNSWENFITQVPVKNEGLNPEFAVKMPKWNVKNNDVYSLWDYFGLETNKAPIGDARPSDLFKRAYNLIYNTYYRDENLQDEIDIKENEDVLFCNVSKDYLTSAFTERQRGPVTGLPVNSYVTSTNLPFTMSIRHFGDGSLFKSKKSSSFCLTGRETYSGGSVADRVYYSENENGDLSNISVGYTGGGLTGTLTDFGDDYPNRDLPKVETNAYVATSIDPRSLKITSTAFDISDLRLAYQIQKWQERSLRGGVRYTEFLHSFFGVSPRDDRLQRPEYIGGTRTPVVSTEVIQTSSTTSNSPLGNNAGHLISADGNFVGSVFCEEYCIIMGLTRIVPKVKYTTGIDRKFLRNTPFDYYFPTFAHLSEQGIYNEEVFVIDGDQNTNLSIWGYQGIYNEMRSSKSRVVAGLRDSNNFLYWTMARVFSSLPNLNGNFISTKYMQSDFMRVFNITDENLTRPCIVHVYNNNKSKRPMPFLATPS